MFTLICSICHSDRLVSVKEDIFTMIVLCMLCSNDDVYHTNVHRSFDFHELFCLHVNFTVEFCKKFLNDYRQTFKICFFLLNTIYLAIFISVKPSSSLGSVLAC